MIYNLGQLRQMIAQNMGIQNSANPPVYDFDDSTPFTQSQINNWINDTYREITSQWDYTFLESTKSMPFYHVISGVQSVELYCSGTYLTTPVSGVTTLTPYPSDVLSYAWTADNSVQNINNNFAGLGPFTINIGPGENVPMISYSGQVVTANWSGVGFQYQLDDDVAKITGLFLQASANGNTGYGIALNEMTYHDFAIKYPIGVVQISGTPYEYCKIPGLGPDNELAIVLAPNPTPDFSGNTMILNYMRKHVDLVEDTDKANVLPTQFQQIIVLGVCEKITSFFAQLDPRVELFHKQKENLIVDMKQWDFNQANLARRFNLGPKNGPFGGTGRSMYDTSQNIYVP